MPPRISSDSLPDDVAKNNQTIMEFPWGYPGLPEEVRARAIRKLEGIAMPCGRQAQVARFFDKYILPKPETLNENVIIHRGKLSFRGGS